MKWAKIGTVVRVRFLVLKMNNKTYIILYNNTRAIRFTYESHTLHETELTFTELEYRFNGLGYNGINIKDSKGNVLAHLLKIEVLPIDSVIVSIKTIFTIIGDWLKKLKWW